MQPKWTAIVILMWILVDFGVWENVVCIMREKYIAPLGKMVAPSTSTVGRQQIPSGRQGVALYPLNTQTTTSCNRA